jgi:hypothetical protein
MSFTESRNLTCGFGVELGSRGRGTLVQDEPGEALRMVEGEALGDEPPVGVAE